MNFVNKDTGEIALGFLQPPFNNAEEIPDDVAKDIASYKYIDGEFIYSPEPSPTSKTDIEILKDENAKLRQDLKSTQAAVDFILLYY